MCVFWKQSKAQDIPTLTLSVFSSSSSLFIQPISHSNCIKSSNKLQTHLGGSQLSFSTNTQSSLWRPHSPYKIFVLPDQIHHAWSQEVWWRMLIQEPAFYVWACYGETFTPIMSSGGSGLGWIWQLEKRAHSSRKHQQKDHNNRIKWQQLAVKEEKWQCKKILVKYRSGLILAS